MVAETAINPNHTINPKTIIMSRVFDFNFENRGIVVTRRPLAMKGAKPNILNGI
jgi:hypothetical protein